MKRRIYVSHPWGDNPIGNKPLVMSICAALEERGFIPVFPPFMFPWLDESDPEQRARGIEMALEMVPACDEMQVYRPGGRYGDGQAKETLKANEHRVKVTWMADEEWPNG